MKLKFNIGWQLERKLYDMDVVYTHKMPASRSIVLRRAWSAVYKSCRHDIGYDQYNRSHNRYFEITNNKQYTSRYKKLI